MLLAVTATKSPSNFWLNLKIIVHQVRGGDVWQNTNNLFIDAGINGVYWSSTPHSNGSSAYVLYFVGTTSVSPSDYYGRYVGLSVRCLCSARSPTNKVSSSGSISRHGNAAPFGAAVCLQIDIFDNGHFVRTLGV